MAIIDTILFAVLIGSIILLVIVFVWSLFLQKSHKHTAQSTSQVEVAAQEVLQKKLHAEGRDEVQKAVNENVVFIQQDMRRTTSELNGYMQQEITRTLNDELKKYGESADQVNQLALDAIAKTQAVLEAQHLQLTQQLAEQIASEKERLLTRFEDTMTEVVGHYVTIAIGNQINVKDQLDYIIGELKENKQAILEDLRSDA